MRLALLMILTTLLLLSQVRAHSTETNINAKEDINKKLQILASYAACRSSNDCKITEGVCGEGVAFSRTNYGEAKKLIASLRHNVDCPDNVKKGQNMPVCGNGRCTAGFDNDGLPGR
jgi:hypothetical protein